MSDLEGLLKRLVEREFEFVIIGGYAATAHGVTLITQDLDICCPFTVASLMKLQAALADLHPVHRQSPRKPPLRLTPRTCRGWKNLYLETDWGVLDCIGRVKGIGDYRAAFGRSIEADFPFGQARLLGLDGLIKAKAALSEPKDKEALRQLLMIKAKQSA